MTQEDFDEVSSRVYVSALERGIKQPTLAKVDALSAVLEVHPLTLLVLSYCREIDPREVQAYFAAVLSEVQQLADASD